MRSLITWKDKTCESCDYRRGISCHRYPPNGLTINSETAILRPVIGSFEPKEDLADFYFFEPACGEWTDASK